MDDATIEVLLDVADAVEVDKVVDVVPVPTLDELVASSIVVVVVVVVADSAA